MFASTFPESRYLEPALGEKGDYDSPVREPPAWKLNCKIGRGAFGNVFLERVQAFGTEFPELWAVKLISRHLPNLPAKQYRAEIKNLQALSNHEWFVKFYSSYEDANYVYIAMEYFPIGDMSKTFANGYRWNESDTKVVLEQLLHGLAAMHGAGITHRDLKPSNIFLYLIENETQALRVKIGDFGTSKYVPLADASTYLKTTTGTRGYMAPEMDDTAIPKTNRVDIWSLGCILYQMLACTPLFPTTLGLYKYAIAASSPPAEVKNAGFSVSCVNFLSDVLQPEPEGRPSAEDCLNKAWITNKASGPGYSIGKDLYSRLTESERAAPRLEPLAGAAVNLAVGTHGAPAGKLPAWKLNYSIGDGSIGTVFLEKVQTLGVDSPELWAVKRIPKAIPNFSAKRYQEEVRVLQKASNSEWLVKFITSYVDADYVYIAMEYFPIGDMSKTFVKGYRWNESDTKVVIEQLLHGLVAMHKEGITHRDLKPEGIYLCLPYDQPFVLRVKIGDFGVSKRVPLSDYTRLKATEYYMAPEMDDTELVKTNAVDIWSLGCILFKMIGGAPLFFSRIEVHRYTSSPPESVEKSGFSVSCIDFLREVLNPESKDRPSAKDCLKKAWITSKTPGSGYHIGPDLYVRLLSIEREAPDP